MKRYLLGLSAFCLALAGCDSVSERECGVFDHPDLNTWQANADMGGSRVSFMSEDGSTREFTRAAAVLNEPFLGTDGASNDEDVICELTAEVRLLATDNSLAMTSIYRQQERLPIESADEAFLIDHRIEAPAGTALSGNYQADISIGRSRVNINPDRVIYLEPDQLTEEIGGLAYEDVVRINAQALSDETSAVPTAANFVQQIVFARNFGIIGFTDAENRIFVRLASP